MMKQLESAGTEWNSTFFTFSDVHEEENNFYSFLK